MRPVGRRLDAPELDKIQIHLKRIPGEDNEFFFDKIIIIFLAKRN
jgi:hypothetical protein